MSQTSSGELSLKEIIDFLKRNGRVVLLWGLAALALASAYAAIVPDKFEAHWQLRMAQFVTSYNSSNGGDGSGSAGSRGIMVEDPAALIQRLRLPTTYPAEVRRACGMTEDAEFGEYLDHALEVSVVKNVAGLVDMKVLATSPDRAMRCAESLVAMISAQQHAMIEDQTAGHKAQVQKYRQTLMQLERQLGNRKPDVSAFGSASSYNSMARLRVRIDDLEGGILQSQLHPSKLTAPIYVPSKPVSPRITLVLLLGGALGLIMGLLYALGYEGWRQRA